MLRKPHALNISDTTPTQLRHNSDTTPTENFFVYLRTLRYDAAGMVPGSFRTRVRITTCRHD